MLQSVADGKVAPQVASQGPRRVRSTRNLPHIPGGKIPEPLAEISRQAMAREQGDRHQTVKELQAAVQSFQAGPLPSPEEGPQVSEGKTSVANGKIFLPLVIALSVIIAVLIGLCIKLSIDRSRVDAVAHGKP
jgi:hypothetical protein